MIVADTNLIAHLLLPGEHTRDSERVYEKDPHWIAPLLWRSEFRNVLALYMQCEEMTLEVAWSWWILLRRLLCGNRRESDTLSLNASNWTRSRSCHNDISEGNPNENRHSEIN